MLFRKDSIVDINNVKIAIIQKINILNITFWDVVESWKTTNKANLFLIIVIFFSNNFLSV